MDERILALANFLGCKAEDLKQGYDNNAFEYVDEEYLVLNEDEADEKAADYIKNSLWAFNTDFIFRHSVIKQPSEAAVKAFAKMQSELCESANELVEAMIVNIERFIEDAIAADGRGHFISWYDGNENEENGYLIYRTN